MTDGGMIEDSDFPAAQDAILAIYKKALADLSGNELPLHYGPAHVVWEDGNYDSAEECLKDFDEHRENFTNEQLEIVKQSLIDLVAIPLSDREWPDEDVHA